MEARAVTMWSWRRGDGYHRLLISAGRAIGRRRVGGGELGSDEASQYEPWIVQIVYDSKTILRRC